MIKTSISKPDVHPAAANLPELLPRETACVGSAEEAEDLEEGES